MAFEADSNNEDDTVPTIESIVNITLDLPPSCIEFSPLNPLIFLVGTYLLKPGAGKGQSGDPDTAQTSTAQSLRSGSLILGLICERNKDVAFANHDLQRQDRATAERENVKSLCPTTNLRITSLQTLPTPYAVLDLHFSPYDPSICAVATSIGAVCFFALDLMNRGYLTGLKSIQITNPSVLVLSLAWKPSSSTPSIIAASLSNGQIAVFDHEFPDTTLIMVVAHSLEVWTVAWSVLPGTDGAAVLYSGGDDSALCRHSENLQLQDVQINGGSQVEDAYEPLSRDAKTHSAGVTAILPIPVLGSSDQGLFLTGSYDEYIRLLEPAVIGRRSKVLTEKRLGGGVWRLKLLGKVDCTPGPGMRMRVLASCMHAGARVVEISRSIEGTWTIVILAKFEEHESMNYASDACTQVDGDVRNLRFLSTSFYDRKLCVWNIKDHG